MVGRTFDHSVRLAALVLVLAGPAVAQDAPAAAWPTLFPRGVLNAEGNFLKGSEPNRPFDVTLSGALDLVDVREVHVPFGFVVAAAFDDRRYPQHVDYSYEFAPAVRVGPVEIAALLFHTSRHLHDVSSSGPVSWNRLGLRLAHAAVGGRWHLRWNVDGTTYLAWPGHYVDYRWDVSGTGRATYGASNRTAPYVDGTWEVLRCQPQVAGRKWAVGARVEAGLALAFGTGRVDAFVAWDRRIDPTPYSRQTRAFFAFGARLRIGRGGDLMLPPVAVSGGTPLR